MYSLPVLHHVLLGSLTVTNRGGILSRSLHALFEEVALHFYAKDCLIIAHSQCAADLVRFHEVFFTFNIVLITRHFFSKEELVIAPVHVRQTSPDKFVSTSYGYLQMY